MPPPSLSKQEIEDLVSRFSHDVASPLMLVLALSGLFVRTRPDDDAAGDLKLIQAAAEEIAAMVRELGARVAPTKADLPLEPS
jgi:signal transduction histidine kinase